MENIYVLDTSVLIHDPQSIKSFEDCKVVIPLAVLSELDAIKAGNTQKSYSAREATRELDKITEAGGKLTEYNMLPDSKNTLVRVYSFKPENNGLPKELDINVKDNQILATAIYVKSINPDAKVVLVSKDTLLRLIADSLGVIAEDYRKDKLKTTFAVGKQEYHNLDLTQEEYNELIEKKSVDLPRFINIKDHSWVTSDLHKSKHSILVKVTDRNKKDTATIKLIESKSKEYNPWDVKAKNAEQLYVLYLLLEPSIKILTISGTTGSGKSLLTIAAGMHMQELGLFERMVVIRPMVAIGDEVGFLPGPQPLDAKILTPNGWKFMGDLKLEDEVISKNGLPSKVIGIYPKGIKPVFKITTTDGNTTECCEDHLWMTQTWEDKKRNRIGKIRTTKEIKNTLIKENFIRKNKPNHYLPRNNPVNFNSFSLPIPPYVLGALLGDGSLKDSIIFSSTDQEIINRVSNEVKLLNCHIKYYGGINYGIVRIDQDNNKTPQPILLTNTLTGETKYYPRTGIAQKELNLDSAAIWTRCVNKKECDNWKYEFLEKETTWINPIREEISKLGLDKKRSYEKFIPDIYKYNSSVQDRISLLQGLMDTDGTIKRNGEASYCTTSKQLALDIIEIVKSLGGRAILKSRNRIGKETFIQERIIKSKRVSYEFNISLPENINPFYLRRKAERHQCKYIHQDKIKSIELVGEKEVQCILIDDPEHLYITDDYIVTHNTLSAKLEPWAKPVYDNLSYILKDEESPDPKNSKAEYLFESKKIEVAPFTYLRGRSINNTFIYLDECQNISLATIKTGISRAGNKSKVVIAGDLDQIDNLYTDRYSCGLTHVAEAFKNEQIAGTAILTKSERSKIAELAAQLL